MSFDDYTAPITTKKQASMVIWISATKLLGIYAIQTLAVVGVVLVLC